ncbi:hypothetical protein [Candidatus Cyanaurora vandensis]|uniref:hypothetical protein n=1 Tax=Candidatus Cyanaurora vandensis TaxID=2714958 RepID=UPI00257A34C3|nr:hypothetical protein [Candidatus Cyanaurora vandensis]
MLVRLDQAYLEWEKETLARGRLEGELKGKLEGELKGKLKAVPALLARSFSVEEIAQILGLSVDQVAQVQKASTN